MWSFLQNNWDGTVALCALMLTFCQLWGTRKHNRLSVVPNLITVTQSDTRNGKHHFICHLTNRGLGPAKIENFVMYYNKAILAANNVEEIQQKLIEKILEHFEEAEYYVHGYAKGACISANTSSNIMEFIIPQEHLQNPQHLKNFLDHFDIKIDYTSLYGTKYNFDSRKNRDQFLNK